MGVMLKMCCFSNTTDVLVVRNKACYILRLAGFECLPSQQKVREAYRGTHINVPAGSQHMKTIPIPKSMMSAPFLQVSTYVGTHTQVFVVFLL